ncbi:sarcosine oxidase subunit alpha family protein [Prosthecomicrobium hirschii]|uniref:sarcosine oxidase subunit alpha family protein n=1 Tax=Prosthecodimorpha hirschii TaxID=665126 RepID=UPI002220ECA7|nr:sarcosine oxidase subunit alpha family protein [Prosthecomicrobium hirschii]MCW1842407.1 sarcosine oxidase subunit alpha family protein [Prosthecomicrobium hirschii]
MSGWRAASGGRIERSRPIEFHFNGRRYVGYEGDTLASALIANGVDLLARSFKYHRPRGLVAYGADEPNALVEVGEGARREPNVKATQVRLTPGLVARSQNCWPTVGFDLMAVNDLIAPLIPSGFYYKTFKWPVAAWPFYERLIRRAAGMGRAPVEPDPDAYETVHRHADCLVIGGGVAGLAAADAALDHAESLVVVDALDTFGGLGTAEEARIDGQPYGAWVEAVLARLRASGKVTLLPRCTAYGHYDGDQVGLIEEVAGAVRLRRWMIDADRIVLATGAFERPLLFGANDRPGVMLAGAARAYLHRHAAVPGRRCVLYANHDAAYEAAFDLQRAGVAIEAIVDARATVAEALTARCRTAGIRHLAGHMIAQSRGRRRVTGCVVHPVGQPAATVVLTCDLILTSGGWNPAAHLFTHSGGRLRHDARIGALVPDVPTGAGGTPSRMVAVGACAGLFELADCVASGRAAGAGTAGGAVPAPAPSGEPPVAPVGTASKQFVDLQNDVTVADLGLAVREGYRSVEHVKRYTTLGMGTDQGKLIGLNGVEIIAAAQGKSAAAIGNSRPRPPFSPVTFGAMAGPFVGDLLSPARTTPMHRWHAAHGAFFANVGSWRRPQFYRRPGESDMDAVVREASNVRRQVGLTDVSTLGKIDLQGPDVARLLDHVYVNGWSTLQPGRCRYGVMLREDGAVMEDGTTTRLSDDRWFMTTTTGNAERILAHLERARQVDLAGLDVTITAVTEQWGAMAIAGPRARLLLGALGPDFAIDNAALPFMSMAEGRLAGIAARVLRVSFSGELAYEIYTASGDAPAMWTALVAAGDAFGLMPYGTEAMMTMRIEKGLFVPGFEADGRTLPDDLGLGRMVSTKKEFVGRRSLGRSAFTAPDRKQLVGLMTVDPARSIPRGAQIIRDGSAAQPTPVPMDGHVTSVAFSPELDRWIALGLVAGGRAALGETRIAASPLTNEMVPVMLCDPVFIDPEGRRLRA